MFKNGSIEMNDTPSNTIDYRKLVDDLTPIARAAGEAIMEVYRQGTTADLKSDGSPVTVADERAEVIILAGLQNCAGDIAVVSEENAESHKMAAPDRYFLVDPLDGTKEFLKVDGKGSFTVNIALVENGAPKLGIVFAPALDRMFTGIVGVGAAENGEAIKIRELSDQGVVAVASVSHRDAETEDWLSKRSITQTQSIGSSLKFCLVACGQADVYPRFGPTMEWDTAAGDAVLRAAGGRVEHPEGDAFSYSKAEFRNGPFVAYGSYYN